MPINGGDARDDADAEGSSAKHAASDVHHVLSPSPGAKLTTFRGAPGTNQKPVTKYSRLLARLLLKQPDFLEQPPLFRGQPLELFQQPLEPLLLCHLRRTGDFARLPFNLPCFLLRAGLEFARELFDKFRLVGVGPDISLLRPGDLPRLGDKGHHLFELGTLNLCLAGGILFGLCDELGDLQLDRKSVV